MRMTVHSPMSNELRDQLRRQVACTCCRGQGTQLINHPWCEYRREAECPACQGSGIDGQLIDEALFEALVIVDMRAATARAYDRMNHRRAVQLGLA